MIHNKNMKKGLCWDNCLLKLVAVQVLLLVGDGLMMLVWSRYEQLMSVHRTSRF